MQSFSYCRVTSNMLSGEKDFNSSSNPRTIVSASLALRSRELYIEKRRNDQCDSGSPIFCKVAFKSGGKLGSLNVTRDLCFLIGKSPYLLLKRTGSKHQLSNGVTSPQ